MSEELDDIGQQTAAIMKTMLQLATLVALRTRERGQKEAEARAKITEARLKEARELQIREARDNKSKDPRNLELARLVERAVPTVEKAAPGVEKVAPGVQRSGGSKGVSLYKDRYLSQADTAHTAMAATATTAATAASQPLMRYDSTERRMAIAAHLARMGVAPELAAVRMLVEVGQGQSLEDAVRAKPDAQRAVGTRAREVEARGLERVRQ